MDHNDPGEQGLPSEAKASLAPPVAPDQRGLATLAIGFVIALVALLLFAFVADRIYSQEAFALDAVATPFLHAIASPGLDLVMTGITNLGSVPVVAALFIFTEFLLLSRGYHARALFLAVAIGGSVALNSLLKVVVHRPRPALPWAHVLPDYSFPSGHTMNTVVFYPAVALIVWVTFGRRIGLAAVAIALLLSVAVGFSRIYLGYHYLSDVVGGFAAGLGWLLIVALAFETGPRTWARRPWYRPTAGHQT
jgi:membrane-associated phospholipid phosphatase